MPNDTDRITELQEEINRLGSELEKAQEQVQELEKSRQSILYMLEDLNEATAIIAKSKNEWEATFDSISEPLFIHDKEFKIIRANMAYRDASGMKFKEFIGRPYYEVFPKMEKPFKMCLKAQELQEEEEEFSCPVTNRIFKVRFYPIKDVNGGYLYSIHILEDITEAKRAVDKIKHEMEITSHLLMIADATAHTTDIDKLLHEVMHCGHEIMKCDVCLSYLWNEEAKAFRPSQQYGLPHELIPLFMTEPMDEKIEFIKKVLEKREPLILPSPQRGENTGEGKLFPYLPDVKIVAAIPLLGREEPLGIIIGIYKGEIEITEREGKIMRGISHQVSTALEEAKLYRESIDRAIELSHKIETIQVMHEIDRNILSTLGMQEIMETAVRLISRVIPSCERATVVLVDKGRQGFIYTAGFGTTVVPKGAFVPFEDTSAAEVVKTERTQYIADMRGVKRHLSLEERLLKEGFLSHIRTPLIVKGDVAAVLSIGSKSPSAFTPDNLSTLEKIASQIGVALENARLVTDLDELFMGTVRALSSAIDAKSPWTRGHSERVTQYALSIAREMGMEEMALNDIELAGLLHDVGKIGTYESILDKPGRLTDAELKVMRQHPVKGAEILAPIKQMQKLIPAIKYHHEFYDGNGYPDGVRGEEIPLYARILAVADTVDAMHAERPYRKGRSADVIVEELKRCSGTQFDPNVVEAFLKTIAKGFIHLQ
jgi:putative nucleotidyltransferase with HDIG domain/PAS domain S-box-containing protein